MKEDQDGAEPAAASVAVANLLRLAAMAPREAAEKLRQRACDTLAAHQDRLRDVPVALTQMCCSAFLLSAGRSFPSGWSYLCESPTLDLGCA